MNLKKVKALFLDLDGVLWHGSKPIGDLENIFAKLSRAEIRPYIGTNNATLTPSAYQKKLRNFGVTIDPEQVMSPAVAAAWLFQTQFPSKPVVHVFGSPALKEYLSNNGFQLSDERADVVLTSLDKEMTYKKVAVAMRLINKGATFYATNTDPILASEEGWLPGGGVIVNAVTTCTGKTPVVIGKPEPFMIKLVMEKFNLNCEELIAVGDRYDTDILGGIRAGCKTVLVQTGVDNKKTIAEHAIQPDLILKDLNELADMLSEAKRN